MESYIDYVMKLNLIPHPEGGFYKEVYRSDETVNKNSLPERYDGDRNFGTSIYYLLPKGCFSSFHKLKSDEIWHFYVGSPIYIYLLKPESYLQTVKLGNNISNNEVLQFTVLKDTWFAAAPGIDYDFSLIGCTVFPGFSFNDFELASRDELIKSFPEHKDLIETYTIK